jgi:hypothetical protein
LRTIALGVALIGILATGAGCGKAKEKKPASQAASAPPDQLAAPAPSPQLPRAESRRLAPGTIKVKVLGVLDSSTPIQRFERGSIAEDVLGADSRLAIPAGTPALLESLRFVKIGYVSEIDLSIYSVDLNGHQYTLSGEDRNPAIAVITVDSVRTPAVTTVHISEGDIVAFKLAKPAELR